MAPVVAEIALENRNTFAVAKLNIKNARQTLQKYPIRATPTYIVFQDGKVVDRSAGVMPKNQLLQRILSAINN
jgi:thioredoxin 1